MKLKKILSVLLCLVMLSSMSLALADSSSSRVAIGSDLNEEQINQVYKTFRINRGDVTELTVTNNDERAYLSKSVDASMIGTKAISCIFIEALNEGSGLNVSTSNISWCTPDTYRNALTTAGITDANVTITAPFSVSGTAALTGIYMAYESITGKKLDETAKQVGSEELAVSSELANEIGDEDTSAIVNDLKAILDQTRNMSDEELRSTIVSIASDYDQNLTEEQIQKHHVIYDLVTGSTTVEYYSVAPHEWILEEMKRRSRLNVQLEMEMKINNGDRCESQLYESD